MTELGGCFYERKGEVEDDSGFWFGELGGYWLTIFYLNCCNDFLLVLALFWPYIIFLNHIFYYIKSQHLNFPWLHLNCRVKSKFFVAVEFPHNPILNLMFCSTHLILLWSITWWAYTSKHGIPYVCNFLATIPKWSFH